MQAVDAPPILWNLQRKQKTYWKNLISSYFNLPLKKKRTTYVRAYHFKTWNLISNYSYMQYMQINKYLNWYVYPIIDGLYF